MAGSPGFKIYNADGVYVAACKFAEEAAALVAFLGTHATIRDGHSPKRIVWKEGAESQRACESFDYVFELADTRMKSGCYWATPKVRS